MMVQTRQKRILTSMLGKRPALVATNILSRGIDNPNVTLVINVDLPQKHSLSRDDREVYPDPECFVHRIGRSGRWTKKGASVSLICAAPEQPDIKILKDIERALFVTPDGGVNRPMIMVPDASKLGEYLAKNLTAIQ